MVSVKGVTIAKFPHDGSVAQRRGEVLRARVGEVIVHSPPPVLLEPLQYKLPNRLAFVAAYCCEATYGNETAHSKADEVLPEPAR